MLKKIKKLDVDAEALIEIVENENGQRLVLKTATPYEVVIEKKFTEIINKYNIPSLLFYNEEELLPNQLLLEYVDGSPTLGKSETTEWFIKWGQIVRCIHNVHSNESIKILENGSLLSIDWREFLKERYLQATEKNNKNNFLEKKLVEKIGIALERLINMNTNSYSLIHGDLHSNNAIIKEDKVILFDKGSFILYGDPFYDLAIFMINFGFSTEKEDIALTAAFIDGYGKDFINANKERIDLNTLLRAFERHGNKFEPQTGSIILSLLNKYQF